MPSGSPNINKTRKVLGKNETNTQDSKKKLMMRAFEMILKKFELCKKYL